MRNYKYELRKGSTHTICPNCGRKTFKPYVFAGTNNNVDASKYGRCERINNCAYLLYPSQEADFEPRERGFSPKPKPDFINPETVRSTMQNYNENVFVLWVASLFGAEVAMDAVQKYNIGTAKRGGTIFWQQDKEGNFRTGKVFYYERNGKRSRFRNNWFLHSQISDDYVLEQVFFGEHLASSKNPTALCESEKTAICMSVFEPQYTWVASGGAFMLNLQRLIRLPRLDFVSPDNGMFERWEMQTKHFARNMDFRVERAVREGLLKKGSDILDLYLLEKSALND